MATAEVVAPRSLFTGWLAPLAIGALGIAGNFLGYATAVWYWGGDLTRTQVDGSGYVPGLLLAAGIMALVGLLPGCRPFFAVPAAVGIAVVAVMLSSLVGEFEHSQIGWGYWALTACALLMACISIGAALLESRRA